MTTTETAIIYQLSVLLLRRCELQIENNKKVLAVGLERERGRDEGVREREKEREREREREGGEKDLYLNPQPHALLTIARDYTHR